MNDILFVLGWVLWHSIRITILLLLYAAQIILPVIGCGVAFIAGVLWSVFR